MVKATALRAVLTALIVLAGAAASPAQVDYVYFDDFAADAAMSDSYWHSPFVEVIPDIYLDGLLCYVDGINERALGLFGGFEVGADAYLGYAFPVEGPMPGIANGRLEIEIPIAWGRPPQGHLAVSVSFEGAAGGFTEYLTDSGAYGYDLSPTVPCERVVVQFVGTDLALDDLSISLSVVTAADHESWANIKALYR